MAEKRLHDLKRFVLRAPVPTSKVRTFPLQCLAQTLVNRACITF